MTKKINTRYFKKQGFDLTVYDRSTGHYWVRCSQCETLVINGVACHERSCPNAKRRQANS